MAGKIKILLDQLIERRTRGESALVAPLKIKLIMKGIDPDMYDLSSPDDPAMIQKVISVAGEMGFNLNAEP